MSNAIIATKTFHNNTMENNTMARIKHIYAIIVSSFIALVSAIFGWLDRNVFTLPVALAALDGVLFGATLVALFTLVSAIGFINLLALFMFTWAFTIPAIYMVLYRENLSNHINEIKWDLARRGIWV